MEEDPGKRQQGDWSLGKPDEEHRVQSIKCKVGPVMEQSLDALSMGPVADEEFLKCLLGSHTTCHKCTDKLYTLGSNLFFHISLCMLGWCPTHYIAGRFPVKFSPLVALEGHYQAVTLGKLNPLSLSCQT